MVIITFRRSVLRPRLAAPVPGAIAQHRSRAAIFVDYLRIREMPDRLARRNGDDAPGMRRQRPLQRGTAIHIGAVDPIARRIRLRLPLAMRRIVGMMRPRPLQRRPVRRPIAPRPQMLPSRKMPPAARQRENGRRHNDRNPKLNHRHPLTET